jgi:hypothetical protein
VNYHSHEAFEQRMLERQKSCKPLSLRVFYHVCCIGDWRDVVAEQTRLLAHVGLRGATCAVLGTHAQVDAVRSIAGINGVSLGVEFQSTELKLYERPTLDIVHSASKHRSDAVLYFHTKGVSAPGDAHKVKWRRVMQREVIAEWRRNLRLLELADILGMDWRCDPSFPHFCGNFWMARCDWVANLPSVDEYRRDRRGWGVDAQDGRMVCETWLGSRPYHHVESIGGFDTWICFGGVDRFRVDVPGFSYS